MTAMRRNGIVALHGFAGTGRDLAGLAAAAGAAVFAPDLAGHAGCPPPPPAERNGFVAVVDDLAARVRERGGPADWVGYSMGGRIALAVATRHPDVVRSLVLIGASAGIGDAAARAERRAADERWARLIEAEGLAAFFERWDAQPLFRGRRGPREALPPHEPADLAAALRTLGPGAQPPLGTDDLARVRCPVLLVAGEDDPKFIAIASDLAGRLPAARVEVVPGAGHAVHEDAPAALTERIADFLRRIP